MALSSEVKTCPKCRLINPPEAELCDCGYDFIKQNGGIQKPGFFDIKGQGAVIFAIVVIIVISALYLCAFLTHNQKLENAVFPIFIVIAFPLVICARFMKFTFIARHFRNDDDPSVEKKRRKNRL